MTLQIRASDAPNNGHISMRIMSSFCRKLLIGISSRCAEASYVYHCLGMGCSEDLFIVLDPGNPYMLSLRCIYRVPVQTA